MSRQLKFRGRKSNGEWVFGSFIQDALEGSNSDLVSWGFIMRYNRGVGKMETIEVDRETVGQFTGLKDNNGVEIFEGDICSLLYYQMRCVGCVEFNEKKSRFEIRSGGWTVLFHEAYKIEVIGNIHDNPELIEAAINRSMI